MEEHLFINSGDHDMRVPFAGTEAWTRSMGYQIIDKWTAWSFDGQVAGPYNSGGGADYSPSSPQFRADMELLGPNNQFLPKIVDVFAEVLCAGKDLATVQGRMINLLRQLQKTLPPQTLASTWSSLQRPQQQIALQSILSS